VHIINVINRSLQQNLITVEDLTAHGVAEVTPDMIAQSSEAITIAMGAARASDGTVTILEEGIEETITAINGRSSIGLGRWPVSNVTSVDADGIPLDPQYYSVNHQFGDLVFCRPGHGPSPWPCEKLVVRYTAGWRLNLNGSWPLPRAIKKAVIDYIIREQLNDKSNSSCGYEIRSESIDGVGSWDYFRKDSRTKNGLPIAIAEMLHPYQRPIAA